jgi:soluble lytic murein transglycosylase-like protein
MSVILRTYHLKELHLMKRKVLRTHLCWAVLCLCMLVVVAGYRMENKLVTESYRTFKGEFQTLMAKQRLYALLRSKALTVGQALDVADAVLGQNKVPVAIALGMISVESEFNPNAASDHGARGLTQLMPIVWKIYASKFNPKHINDVSLNVKVGLTYLGDLHTEYKDWRMALRAYNAGPENAHNKRYDTYANSVLRKAKEFDHEFEGV